MRHFVSLLTVGALTLAGCASGSRSDPSAAFPDRAAAVASAWQDLIEGSHIQAWRTELIPLQALTMPPSGDLADDVRHAFDSGWYRTGIDLSQDAPAAGEIVLPDGSVVTVALISAANAYREIDQGDPPCAPGEPNPDAVAPTPTGTGPGAPDGGPAVHSCTSLTVTGVTLDTAEVRTNRGLVTMPAWRFQVAEAATPVVRVAVAAAEFGRVPQPDLAPWEQPQVAAVAKLTSAADRRVDFTIGIGACSTDPVGLVYETSDVVVIGGWATLEANGPCPGSLAFVPVSVTLADPLGSRVILDAVTGRVVL